MDKSSGEDKFRNMYKTKLKYLNKKTPYADHRNRCSLHKTVRTYVSSYINHVKYNYEQLEEFYFPQHSMNTYNFWNCDPWKPKVYL